MAESPKNPRRLDPIVPASEAKGASGSRTAQQRRNALQFPGGCPEEEEVANGCKPSPSPSEESFLDPPGCCPEAEQASFKGASPEKPDVCIEEKKPDPDCRLFHGASSDDGGGAPALAARSESAADSKKVASPVPESATQAESAADSKTLESLVPESATHAASSSAPESLPARESSLTPETSASKQVAFNVSSSLKPAVQRSPMPRAFSAPTSGFARSMSGLSNSSLPARGSPSAPLSSPSEAGLAASPELRPESFEVMLRRIVSEVMAEGFERSRQHFEVSIAQLSANLSPAEPTSHRRVSSAQSVMSSMPSERSNAAQRYARFASKSQSSVAEHENENRNQHGSKRRLSNASMFSRQTNTIYRIGELQADCLLDNCLHSSKARHSIHLTTVHSNRVAEFPPDDQRQSFDRGTSQTGSASGSLSTFQKLSKEIEDQIVFDKRNSYDATSSQVARTWLHFTDVLMSLATIVRGGRGQCWRIYGFVLPFCLVGLIASYLGFLIQESRYTWVRALILVYSVGSLIGLWTLRRKNVASFLDEHDGRLQQYAFFQGYYFEWRYNAAKSCCVPFLMWVLSTATWFALIYGIDRSEDDDAFVVSNRIVSYCLSSVGGGLFALLACCQGLICTNLALMVDYFCLRVFESFDPECAVEEWNVLQVVLRQAANVLQGCLIIVQTSVLVALLLFVAELQVGQFSLGDPKPLSLWILLLNLASYVLLALWCLFQAAGVTERCKLVPPLLNSLRMDDVLSKERQYLVEFVEHSHAGFYVMGVRLTGFMAVKISYVMAVVSFAILTRYMQP